MQAIIAVIILLCTLSTGRSAEPPCADEDNHKCSYTLRISDDIHAHIIFDGGLKPSDVDSEHREVLQNKHGDIFGCTIRPATKTGYPCVFVRLRNGDLVIMHNLNRRIQHLFKKAPKGFDSNCIILEAIVGRTLVFNSDTHSDLPAVRLRVRIAKDGTMKLLREKQRRHVAEPEQANTSSSDKAEQDVDGNRE